MLMRAGIDPLAMVSILEDGVGRRRRTRQFGGSPGRALCAAKIDCSVF